MKLGALKTAIREMKENPKVRFMLNGNECRVAVQKASILAELDRLFPGGRAQETGLHIHPEGYLSYDDNVDG